MSSPTETPRTQRARLRHAPSTPLLPLLELARRRIDDSAPAREPTRRSSSRQRLDRAATALLLGRRTVVEIAVECGFATHEMFSRAFLRRFGMTPRAYQEHGLSATRARELIARELTLGSAPTPRR